MPAALASVLRRAPLTPEKVSFAWRTAVGAALDRATGVELRGSTRVVQVRTEEWRHELSRSMGMIRARLNIVLGDDAVQRIDLQSDVPR